MLLLQLTDAAKVAAYQPGQTLEIAEMFKAGDNVDVAGTTVGKGFQGEQQEGSSKDIKGSSGLSSSGSGCRLVLCTCTAVSVWNAVAASAAACRCAACCCDSRAFLSS